MGNARLYQYLLLVRSAALGSTSALSVAQGLVLGSSLIVNIVSARILGPSGRGELALHLQISYLLSSAIVLGRDQTLLVYGSFPSIRSAHRGVRRLAMVPAFLCVVPAILAGAFFSENGLRFVEYVTAYGSMLFGSLCFRMGRAVAIITDRAWSFSLAVGTGQVLLCSSAVALFLIRNEDPILWLLIYGLSSTVPIVCWSLMVGRGSIIGARDLKLERSVRRLGYRMIPATVADVILLRFDRLLLPVVGSFSSLGIYVVASTFTELSSILIRQYTDGCTPIWKARLDCGTLRLMPLLGIMFALSSGVSAIVGMAGYFLIPVLFGPAYLPALPLVPVLAAAAALYGTSRLGVALAAILGVPRWASIVNGLGAAVGVIAYLILIPMLGALGAALGSLVAYGACAVCTVVFCLRKNHLDPTG